MMKILILTALAMFNSSAYAAIILSSSNNGDQAFYSSNALTTDLINIGSSSLGGFAASNTSVGAGTSLTGLHDGSTSKPSGFSYWGTGGGVPVTLTYALDISTNTAGYDISSINTIYGWGDSRSRHAAQHYDVEITTVINPTFTALTSVDYDPFNDTSAGSTQVSMTDDTGLLASGVTGIRFTLRSDNGTEIGVIHEFDVIGSPATIPEPSAALLLVLSMCSLLRKRRIMI